MENYESAIDKIFDENNNDNIVLYNDKGEPTEFEQAALVPIDGKPYVLLSLANPTDEIASDEGFVFAIEIDDEGTESLRLVTDESIIDAVFEVYEGLLEALLEEDDLDDEPASEDGDLDELDLDDEPEIEEIDLDDLDDDSEAEESKEEPEEKGTEA